MNHIQKHEPQLERLSCSVLIRFQRPPPKKTQDRTGIKDTGTENSNTFIKWNYPPLDSNPGPLDLKNKLCLRAN